MNRTLEGRVVRLEERRGTRTWLSDMSDSELLSAIAEVAETLTPEQQHSEGWDSILAQMDEAERKLAAFNSRPDVAADIAANVASGRVEHVQRREGFRWPHLLQRDEWHEKQYPIKKE